MSLFQLIFCCCCLILMIRTAVSQHSYDSSNCTSGIQAPGSNYQCSPNSPSCETFIVYRAQKDYQTLNSIASLFSSSIAEILSYNNFSQVDQNLLQPGYEIVIPVTCFCSEAKFSRAVYQHNASRSDSLSAIACGTFEGLMTAASLRDYNQDFQGDNQSISSIQVPIKCACPNTSDIENGINYLVTYPILEHDNTSLISLKFDIPQKMLADANRLVPFHAIFPQTTLLVPLTYKPFLNPAAIVSSQDEGSSPGVLVPGISETETKSKNLFAILGGVMFAASFCIAMIYGTVCFIWRKNGQDTVKDLSRRAPRWSNFGSEFLDDMSKLKHSFTYFSMEELMVATENFSEGSLLGAGVYRGKIGDSCMVIKQISSREVANNIICILTKINHLNVVKLEGFYDGTLPYLVFELAENGSLRECLSHSNVGKQLTWNIRTQVAFDLAEGLHYLHYCTKPTYVHRNINSRNVLLTADWRAKISGFGSAKPLDVNNEKGKDYSKESAIVGREGYLAPEYLKYGQASTKVDVYAFGVVLIELLSGKEATTNGELLKNFLKSAANKELHQGSPGYLEMLEQFMDPLLEKDYPVDDALYLACLAKACMEEDPLSRPTMNDVLMALSRIL
ncbi:protein LYK5-like [Coffea eugenioides]|uniref:LysM domain receptor-like kinase 4 n=1 Tax=Coffea arabica TaxID=13443 RepID=A0A6P6X8K4_COFAR|nr:protein LYK5-like [Coffea arabica]XP_027169228.1 protein LYK5-like [Coffea eugenioides]